MESDQEPAAAPSTQQGTEEGERVEVITQRHSDGADGTRPGHSALACREYGLLAPEEPAGDPATVGPQGSGDIPEDTLGIGGTNGR